MKFKSGSQNDRIVKHLQGGKRLTRYHAILMFKVQNLTARISEIRAAGYCVTDAPKLDPNGQSYAEYSMTCLACKAGRPFRRGAK